jgi:hypothetical protein
VLRFTTQEIFGLMAVVGVSCMLSLAIAHEPVAKLMVALVLSTFGGGCYVVGVAIGRNDRLSN